MGAAVLLRRFLSPSLKDPCGKNTRQFLEEMGNSENCVKILTKQNQNITIRNRYVKYGRLRAKCRLLWHKREEEGMRNGIRRLTAALLTLALCLNGTPLTYAEDLTAEQSVCDAPAAEDASVEEAPESTAEGTETGGEEESGETAPDFSAEQSAENCTESVAAEAEPDAEASVPAPEDSSAAEVTSQRVITGFGAFDTAGNSLTVAEHNLPTEAELMARMPETLEVQLDGSDTYTELPVEWFCLGDEYGEENIYLLQYSPRWEEDYTLSEEIDLYTQAPCILVYVSDETEESISACASVSTTYAAEEQEIFEYLQKELGYNAAAACGVLANMYAESAMKPTNLQNTYEKKLGYTDASYTKAVDTGKYKKFDSDSAGYGLCQWTVKVLKKPMHSLAKNEKESIGSLSLQLEYLKKTLSKNDQSCLYNGATINSKMKKISNNASGAYKAAYYWCEQYERPGDTKNQAIKRGNSAKSRFWPIYKKYQKQSLTVTLSASSVTYNGSQQKPGVTVKCGSALLDEGTDYTVSYQNNVNVGVATVVVTGKNTYSGSKSTSSFTIQTAKPVLQNASHVFSGITVQWAASPGATRYRLFRKNGSSWVKVGDTTDTQLTDTSATRAGSYTYTVRCIADSGEYVSGYDKNGLTVQRLGTPALKKVSNCSNGTVNVTWGAVSGASCYRVYRKTSASSWQKLADTSGLSYRDQTAQNGKCYTYTVRCVDADTGTNRSGYTKGLTVCCLSAPRLSSAASRSGRKIDAAWTKNSASGGYQIRYQTGKKAKSVKVSSAKTLKKTLTKLSKGKTYTISVRAWKRTSGTTYYSAWSNSIRVKVKN